MGSRTHNTLFTIIAKDEVVFTVCGIFSTKYQAYVNIAKYTKVITLIKRQSEGYKPRKSKVLLQQEFDDFLHNTPNNIIYLATKVNICSSRCLSLR
ncbi:hypothetical protein FQR65_LT10422 [Abscondita terminalis]|nr:hypothetical protein FQR65_LT10422 [Abscondita terminalis]